MKKVLSTSEAPQAIGPYSQGIEASGSVVYVSGQIPCDPVTGEVSGSDMSSQAERSLKNLGAVLDAAGISYRDVVKTTCFITDMSEFSAFNDVYSKYFIEEPPARSCIAVHELPKGVLCEVEALAIKR
mgnify:CR=1 FL=1